MTDSYWVSNEKGHEVDRGFVDYDDHDIGVLRTIIMKSSNSKYHGKNVADAYQTAAKLNHKMNVVPYRFSPRASKKCAENMENIGVYGLESIEIALVYLAKEIDRLAAQIK